MEANKEVDALDLLGAKATELDFLKAEAMLEANYGVSYPKEKFSMLWSMINEDNWSKERLQHVLKWFLKNKPYPNWTIADFYALKTPKLYSYSHYLQELSKNQRLNDEIDWTKVNGILVWYYKSDNLNLSNIEIKSNN